MRPLALEHVFNGSKHLGSIDVTNQQQPVNGKVWKWGSGGGGKSEVLEAPQFSSASANIYFQACPPEAGENDEKNMSRRTYPSAPLRTVHPPSERRTVSLPNRDGNLNAGDTTEQTYYSEWMLVNGGTQNGAGGGAAGGGAGGGGGWMPAPPQGGGGGLNVPGVPTWPGGAFTPAVLIIRWLAGESNGPMPPQDPEDDCLPLLDEKQCWENFAGCVAAVTAASLTLFALCMMRCVRLSGGRVVLCGIVCGIAAATAAALGFYACVKIRDSCLGRS